MTESARAVRKTSLAFDLLKKSLTYPRLLRQLIQEVGLSFLRSPELKPRVILPPSSSLLLRKGSYWNCSPTPIVHTIQ